MADSSAAFRPWTLWFSFVTLKSQKTFRPPSLSMMALYFSLGFTI